MFFSLLFSAIFWVATNKNVEESSAKNMKEESKAKLDCFRNIFSFLFSL